MRLRDYVLLAELDLDDTNTDATQDRRPGDDGFPQVCGENPSPSPHPPTPPCPTTLCERRCLLPRRLPFPQFRITGLRLNVELKHKTAPRRRRPQWPRSLPGAFSEPPCRYDNLDDEHADILLNRQVDAKMQVVRAEVGWAGMGPQVWFAEMPSVSAEGVETGAKVIRYRQGVVIEFVAMGRTPRCPTHLSVFHPVRRCIHTTPVFPP